MDPFLEGQRWPDFHTRFLTVLAEVLMPLLLPDYIAVIEARVYVEHLSSDRVIGPDITIVGQRRIFGESGTGAALASPVELPLPLPETHRERYLEIRLRDGGEVVSVVELLSPANKRANSDGQREYLRKRELVLLSASHLVEIDLLRGGERPPLAGEPPCAAYYITVSREARRPVAQVWPVGLRQRLPIIPLPLRQGDDDIPVDLQDVLHTVHERAGYARTLDYSARLVPPLSEADEEWVRSQARP